jgi:hypothetical protein
VAYVAVPEDNPGRPSADYMRHIVDGAAAHSFPDDYIKGLMAIAIIEAETVVISVDEPGLPEPTREEWQ